MPVVTGYLARNLAGFLGMVGAFTGLGLHDGSSDAGIVVGMGLFVTVCSFVAMAVLLYDNHCAVLRRVDVFIHASNTGTY